MIGVFGNIVFSVSQYQVKTFKNMSKDTGVRVAQHDVIGSKPVVEFLGDDLATFNFDMVFSKQLGTNPQDEIDNLERLRENGIICVLIIGGIVYGEYLIEKLGTTFDNFYRNGELVKASVSVSLMEYN